METNIYSEKMKFLEERMTVESYNRQSNYPQRTMSSLGYKLWYNTTLQDLFAPQ